MADPFTLNIVVGLMYVFVRLINDDRGDEALTVFPGVNYFPGLNFGS